MKIFYKTRATAIGGRSGHTALDDGSLALDYDVLVDGVTVGSIKKSIALFDNIVGDFRTFVNQ